jgi:hypothetical protein
MSRLKDKNPLGRILQIPTSGFAGVGYIFDTSGKRFPPGNPKGPIKAHGAKRGEMAVYEGGLPSNSCMDIPYFLYHWGIFGYYDSDNIKDSGLNALGSPHYAYTTTYIPCSLVPIDGADWTSESYAQFDDSNEASVNLTSTTEKKYKSDFYLDTTYWQYVSLFIDFYRGIVDLSDNALEITNSNVTISYTEYQSTLIPPSYYFNSSSSAYLSTPYVTALDFGTGSWIVEFWVKSSSSPSSAQYIWYQGEDSSNYHGCYITSDSYFHYIHVDNGSTIVDRNSYTTATFTNWNYVRVVFDGTNVSVRLNRSTYQTASDTTSKSYNGTFYIGRSSSGQYFNGYMSFFRVTKGSDRSGGSYPLSFLQSTDGPPIIQSTDVITAVKVTYDVRQTSSTSAYLRFRTYVNSSQKGTGYQSSVALANISSTTRMSTDLPATYFPTYSNLTGGTFQLEVGAQTSSPSLTLYLEFIRIEIGIADQGGHSLLGEQADSVLFDLREGGMQLSGTSTTSLYYNIQLIRPSSDVTSDSWFPSTGSSLYDCINEITYSDTDYIYTLRNLTPVTIGMGIPEGPITGNLTIKVRYRLKSNDGTKDYNLYLMSNTTVLDSWTETNVPATFTAYEHISTGISAASVDINNIRIKCELQ